jgi:predicted transcriptional regulator
MNLLRDAVRFQGSQSKVATILGYSSTTISQVLSGNYGGALDTFLQKVEEHFCTQIIACPILGEIQLPECVTERRRLFSNANPLRVQLYKTCSKCRFNSDLKTNITGEIL